MNKTLHFFVFGTIVLRIIKIGLQELYKLQRKMMRRIIGWRRIENEDWSMSMKRMKDRLDQGHRLLYCEPWSIGFARNQLRYIQQLMEAHPLLWARVMLKLNSYPSDDPESDFLHYRFPEHLQMRWHDHIHPFCHKVWTRFRRRYWSDILCHLALPSYKDECIFHIVNL